MFTGVALLCLLCWYIGLTIAAKSDALAVDEVGWRDSHYVSYVRLTPIGGRVDVSLHLFCACTTCYSAEPELARSFWFLRCDGSGSSDFVDRHPGVRLTVLADGESCREQVDAIAIAPLTVYVAAGYIRSTTVYNTNGTLSLELVKGTVTPWDATFTADNATAMNVLLEAFVNSTAAVVQYTFVTVLPICRFVYSVDDPWLPAGVRLVYILVTVTFGSFASVFFVWILLGVKVLGAPPLVDVAKEKAMLAAALAAKAASSHNVDLYCAMSSTNALTSGPLRSALAWPLRKLVTTCASLVSEPTSASEPPTLTRRVLAAVCGASLGVAGGELAARTLETVDDNDDDSWLPLVGMVAREVASTFFDVLMHFFRMAFDIVFAVKVLGPVVDVTLTDVFGAFQLSFGSFSFVEQLMRLFRDLFGAVTVPSSCYIWQFVVALVGLLVVIVVLVTTLQVGLLDFIAAASELAARQCEGLGAARAGTLARAYGSAFLTVVVYGSQIAMLGMGTSLLDSVRDSPEITCGADSDALNYMLPIHIVVLVMSGIMLGQVAMGTARRWQESRWYQMFPFGWIYWWFWEFPVWLGSLLAASVGVILPRRFSSMSMDRVVMMYQYLQMNDRLGDIFHTAPLGEQPFPYDLQARGRLTIGGSVWLFFPMTGIVAKVAQVLNEESPFIAVHYRMSYVHRVATYSANVLYAASLVGLCATGDATFAELMFGAVVVKLVGRFAFRVWPLITESRWCQWANVERGGHGDVAAVANGDERSAPGDKRKVARRTAAKAGALIRANLVTVPRDRSSTALSLSDKKTKIHLQVLDNAEGAMTESLYAVHAKVVAFIGLIMVVLLGVQAAATSSKCGLGRYGLSTPGDSPACETVLGSFQYVMYFALTFVVAALSMWALRLSLLRWSRHRLRFFGPRSSTSPACWFFSVSFLSLVPLFMCVLSIISQLDDAEDFMLAILTVGIGFVLATYLLVAPCAFRFEDDGEHTRARGHVYAAACKKFPSVAQRLMDACANGGVDVARRCLLQLQLNCNFVLGGETPLLCAARGKHAALVRMLASPDVDVDMHCRGVAGNTAAHYIAQMDDGSELLELVSARAGAMLLYTTNNMGETPLWLAVRANAPEAVGTLLRAGDLERPVEGGKQQAANRFCTQCGAAIASTTTQAFCGGCGASLAGQGAQLSAVDTCTAVLRSTVRQALAEGSGVTEPTLMLLLRAEVCRKAIETATEEHAQEMMHAASQRGEPAVLDALIAARGGKVLEVHVTLQKASSSRRKRKGATPRKAKSKAATPRVKQRKKPDAQEKMISKVVVDEPDIADDAKMEGEVADNPGDSHDKDAQEKAPSKAAADNPGNSHDKDVQEKVSSKAVADRPATLADPGDSFQRRFVHMAGPPHITAAAPTAVADNYYRGYLWGKCSEVGCDCDEYASPKACGFCGHAVKVHERLEKVGRNVEQ